MRVFQLLPTMSYGDAVSNDAMALMGILQELGYSTAIYASGIAPNVNSLYVMPAGAMPPPREEDLLIYHMSIGSDLAYEIEKYSCKKVMIYHNVTPPKYFERSNPVLADLTQKGLEQLKYLSDKFDYCMADSEYNRQELLALGYTCQVDVLPILIPFEDYLKTPDSAVIRQNNYGETNILFTGRIAPNKRQEDIIDAFAVYKKKYDPTAKLHLVGTYRDTQEYHKQLQDYVKRLQLPDVYFAGMVSFAALLAYYRTADVFVCMSEHEGFCVPLVEAMCFEVPVIAYAAAAVPDTLGGSGIVLEEKEPEITAGMIDRVMRDWELRDAVLQGQRERLNDFSYESVKRRFIDYLDAFLRGEK